jgi:hypothetical protein
MRPHADSDCTEQSQSEPAGTVVGEHVSHNPDLVEGDLAPEVVDTMVPPLHTLHSVPLDSQKHTRAREVCTGNHTQPLPRLPATSSPITDSRNALTAPLPILPASGSAPALTTMVVPLNDSPSRTLAHKSSASQFPTLRAPSPLRKSMRVVVEPSTGAGILASAAPAPAQPSALGKRTSWLMKAREVKALEGIVHNKANVLGPSAGTGGSSGHTVAPLKRKSGDMLAAASLASDKADEGRRAKVAKASKSDFAPQNSEDPPLNQGATIPTQTPPSILVSPRAVRLPEEHWEPLNDKEEEASFIGVFKRTVEGLGARAGKSMGKSLGGGAAAAALAEARAAAEARVAERNKIDEGQVTESEDSSAPNAEEPQPVTEDIHSRDSERRLSISDVVSANESPVALQSPSAADESVSTTPPNSPPPTRTSGSNFVPPPGPVFNKQPPPVFMPPISKQIAPLTKEFSFNLPTATFTLPPPISLGLPARLTSSPSSRPPPQACGTQQSSQASTLSDAVFDQVEDIPAWMPSTQDTEYTEGAESQIHRAKFATLEDDDDDSWPLEEKLAASEQGWTPFNFNNKEDSMTWSTLPTESQGLTRTRSDLTSHSGKNAVQQDEGPVIPSTSAMDIDGDVAQIQDNESNISEPEADHESVMYTSDLGDVLKGGQPTVTLIEVFTILIISILNIHRKNRSLVAFRGARANYPWPRRLRLRSSHRLDSSVKPQNSSIVCLARAKRPSQRSRAFSLQLPQRRRYFIHPCLECFAGLRVLYSKKKKPTKRPPVSRRWRQGARQRLLARQMKRSRALLRRRRRSRRNLRSANVSATRPRKSDLSRPLLCLRRRRKTQQRNGRLLSTIRNPMLKSRLQKTRRILFFCPSWRNPVWSLLQQKLLLLPRISRSPCRLRLRLLRPTMPHRMPLGHLRLNPQLPK